MSIPETRIEIPPTAGLPLRLRELIPSGRHDLAGGIAEFLGVEQVGIECSGTAALVVILETLRRSSARRQVIVPAYTCPLVVFAVAHCGLEAVVCDVSPRSFDLDPTALERLCGKDTLAVVVTHLGGRVGNLDHALAIAHRSGARVIEDAAQALGARWRGRSVGLQGDAGFFSLAAGKGLTLFEGGAWIAADPGLRTALAGKREEIVPRHAGWEILRSLQLAGYAAAYRPRGLRHVYGNPLRRALRDNDPVAAAGDYFSADIPLHRVSAWRQGVGCRALVRLPDFQRELARQAAERLPRLQAIPGVTVLTDPPGGEGVWPLFFVLLPDEAARDRALAELWGTGLGVARMFAHALTDYEYLHPWLPRADMPNAREFAACSLTISNSPWLDEGRFQRIVDTLARHCAQA